MESGGQDRPSISYVSGEIDVMHRVHSKYAFHDE